jgi:hypothetical protein
MICRTWKRPTFGFPDAISTTKALNLVSSHELENYVIYCLNMSQRHQTLRLYNTQSKGSAKQSLLLVSHDIIITMANPFMFADLEENALLDTVLGVWNHSVQFRWQHFSRFLLHVVLLGTNAEEQMGMGSYYDFSRQNIIQFGVT